MSSFKTMERPEKFAYGWPYQKLNSLPIIYHILTATFVALFSFQNYIWDQLIYFTTTKLYKMSLFFLHVKLKKMKK